MYRIFLHWHPQKVPPAGVQNSLRCLAAENLSLAKRVNRDISEMSFLGHFEPFWVIFGPF